MPDEIATEATALVATSERFSPHSIAAVSDAVRTAHGEGTPLRIVGGGRWLAAGNPVTASRELDVSGLTGIVEYVPGDLTLTALAGTTLAEIAEVTGVHRQWLALDPFGDPRGTLGATLATASAGPLGGGTALPRDVTVGLSFVTGEGELVRGGGRVVKNVAGFDLVRLTIGAWGTLGVITEATVRLRARPEADETVAMKLPEGSDALSTLLSIMRTSAVEPLAAELLSAACAARSGLGREAVMLVRLAGNAIGVDHQRAVLATLSACEPVSNEVWAQLQKSDPPHSAVVRVSRRPTELSRLWLAAISIPDVDAHATLARGVVRLRLTTADRDTLAVFEANDRRVIETTPPSWLHYFRPAPAPDNAIARRLRDAFDPRRILNRGILGEDAS